MLVVDNNSTDKTAEVAASFPFVRLIRESRQGPVFARDAGFDAARFAIIGRIDGDTVLAPDWVATVRAQFSMHPGLSAITGPVEYYDAPWRPLVGWFDLFFRRYLAKRLGSEMYLYGSNMAIRREVWLVARELVCHRRQLHEDLDLAVHLSRLEGGTIKLVSSLRAAVSGRRLDTDLASFYRYIVGSPRTYAAHGLTSQRYMYRVVSFLLVMYGPLRVLFRACDPATGKFSLRAMYRIAKRREERLSPIAEASTIN